MLIVTIDTGTTNTRVRAWRNNTVIGELSTEVGIRDCAKNGSNTRLIQSIKTLLTQLLEKFSDKEKENYRLVASGMITSEIGLYHLPHEVTPVSVRQLAQKARACVINEISERPIIFIPGIKNKTADLTFDTIESMDVMRGEEVEIFGILAQQPDLEASLVILPGSHSKFVRIDDNKNVIAIATTMAGEIFDTLTHQTILASSLDHQFAQQLDVEYLLKGAKLSQQVGIARSCFSVRLLDLFTDASLNQKSSFLLGAILASDLLAIKNSQALCMTNDLKVVISGKPILANALQLLIKNDSYFTGEISLLEDKKEQPYSGLGAISILNLTEYK
ncbi:2-dehydro-3-deoxygalactonokinase [Providencia rettgeri]|uniref:2-dehydro-3-deoxygalactonokinase n=1 Tax=Providencia rettgeri TaxID=587 RepID=UPI0034E068A2